MQHDSATDRLKSRNSGMKAGQRHIGPAVVTEYSATTVVPPGNKFWLDTSGNLTIKVTG